MRNSLEINGPDQSMRPRWRRWVLSATIPTVLLAFSSCASVTAKTDSGRVTREGLRSAVQLGEVSGVSGSQFSTLSTTSTDGLNSAKENESKGMKVDAAADYLSAAANAYTYLVSGSAGQGSEAEKALIGIYNNSLARFTELWAVDPLRLQPGPYFVRNGDEILEIILSSDSPYGRYYFDSMIASDAVVEKGIVHRVRSGCGAAIVAIREQRPERTEEMKFFPKHGLHMPVTITIDSVHKPSPQSGGATRVVLSMRNPLLEETTKIGKRQFPLAANFSAPLAVLLNGSNQNRLSLRGFFKADEQIKQSGVFLIEPYDPNRIPVILIHGLVSVPMIWRDVFPELALSPELAQRYQFMVFTYPSSYPVAESALLLRRKLSGLRSSLDPDGNDPLSNDVVVIGHSMGGILTHSLIADIGDSFWRQVSDLDIDSVDIDEKTREQARERFFFSPDPAVSRAIFIASPHRGAKMAEKGIAGAISTIAKLPGGLLESTTGALAALTSPGVEVKFDIGRRKRVTAIQSLEPGAPMIAALADSPFKKGVSYHSIIGDRGKGDTPDSSDGVVEYWSSRQDGAASELIVPTDHGAYKSPLAIEEMKRILRLHAGIE